MSFSEVDVYNLALDCVGNTEPLANTTDNTKAARVCRRWYPVALEATLKDIPSFTTKAVPLALVAGASFPGYEYVYRYPSDCLQARQITNADGSRLRWYEYAPGYQYVLWLPPKIPYEISMDANGKLILTDLIDAYLVYTARITAVGLFDTLFVNALAMRLAYHIAVPMALDPKQIPGIWTMYRAARGEARRSSLNEVQPDMRPESPSITVRY